MRTRTGKLLKDPLIHFLMLGGLLFFSAPLWKRATAPKNEILITQAGQKHLADLFSLTWQRPPSQDELTNLVAEHIKEEIYYREALALGLDENDTIVRRRMRQKLEFMQEDLSGGQEPSLEDLKTYYVAHKERYKPIEFCHFGRCWSRPSRAVGRALPRKQSLLRKAGRHYPP